MNIAFPNLTGEIAKRGIKKTVIAERTGISLRALYDKMEGKTSFTWEEVNAIHSVFFPDIEKDTLFKRADDRTA